MAVRTIDRRQTAVSDSEILVPFLKWAGGKRWFVSKYSKLIPKSFNRYFEPFLGSGAVFFHVAPRQGRISDSNFQLINAYKVLRSDWKALKYALSTHDRKHCAAHYYATRDELSTDRIAGAARFIYLNRTCWNGLYRVNRKGEFNVPIGSKTRAVLESDDFEALSKRLRSVSIVACDFEKSIDLAEDGDFLFVDPPYTVKHNLNGFIKYNDRIFSWDDQIRLSLSLVRAKERGAQILLTNANHACVRKLYEGFRTMVVPRSSLLSANAAARGLTSELIICS